MSDASSATNTMNKSTHSESDVYDRQIRLWGAESQAKMQKAKVLYIHVTGVTAEVLKNLVLAGIAATLCDPRPTTESVPHFFSSSSTAPPSQKKVKYSSIAHAVQPLVEELNPLLGRCPLLEKKDVSEITADDLKPFGVIMASQIPLHEAVRLSKLATMNGSQFYVGDCFGFCGAAMMDLGPTLEYRPEQGKQLLDPIKVKDYVPLEQIVQVPLHQATNRFHKSPPPVWIQYRCLLEYQQKKGTWPSSVSADDDNDGDTFDETIMQDFLKEQQVTPTMMTSEELQTLAKVGMAQVAPVCAVLGGMLGNEIIKVISGKGEPANNTILLDGNKCKSWTFLVKPKEA